MKRYEFGYIFVRVHIALKNSLGGLNNSFTFTTLYFFEILRIFKIGRKFKKKLNVFGKQCVYLHSLRHLESAQHFSKNLLTYSNVVVVVKCVLLSSNIHCWLLNYSDCFSVSLLYNSFQVNRPLTKVLQQVFPQSVEFPFCSLILKSKIDKSNRIK